MSTETLARSSILLVPVNDGPPGIPGPPGEGGVSYYTWIRYADSETGEGISNSPDEKKYIGIAYNKESSFESNDPKDYIWSLFRGEQGTQGVPGPQGDDGKTYYTWIAYSDYHDGTNMYQIPNDSTRYIGIAVNKETVVESNDPTDYIWSLFRGEDGQDGISVSISPQSCSISSDFNGNLQNLDDAFADIALSIGSKQVSFSLNVVELSDSRIQYTISGTDIKKQFKITYIPPDVLNGYIKFEFKTSSNEFAMGTFQFTVIRDVNMLDWIQDWETNKTKIGGDYLITPQMFVGKKVTSQAGLSVLTGVYIGPTGLAPNSSAGIYGYKEGKEIFYINETGGSIGGWNIYNGGIQTSDGMLNILSEGSIFAKDANGNVIWGMYKNGEAIFAKGNVTFSNNGDASFKGEITSSKGAIGGWKITDNLQYSNHIALDSFRHYIGVSPFDISTIGTVDSSFKHYDKVVSNGGIAIHYTSANSYGIEGYLPGSKNTFKIGSTNVIAGWNFDNDSLYIGVKNNTTDQYTNNISSITIGSAGLRGYGWYINTSGTVSFMKGLFTMNENSGTFLGWRLSENRLSNPYVALLSNELSSGLYLSQTDITSIASSSIRPTIRTKGGVYFERTSLGVELGGFYGNKYVFSLNSYGDSYISGWSFNSEAIFSGTSYSLSGFTSDYNQITLSYKGVRGRQWRLEPDGSGALAGGNIWWDTNGLFSFGASIENRTTIDNGLVLSKNLFVCDSSGAIKAGMSAEGSGETGIRFFAGSSNKALAPFRVHEDGSGVLANGNLKWDKNGTFMFGDSLTNKLGTTTISNGLVLSKNIFVCDSNNIVKAGVSAEGSGGNGVRFFAGSADPLVAPFRVYEDGSVFAEKGTFDGIVKLSADYSGYVNEHNLFLLPPQTTKTERTMGKGAEHIGKVVRLTNSGGNDNADYIIYAPTFGIKDGVQGDLIDDLKQTTTIRIRPGETVELTCYEANPSWYSGTTYKRVGKWTHTSRFGKQNYSSDFAIGRHPLLYAIGDMTYTTSGLNLSYTMYDGRNSLSGFVTATQDGTGLYTISFGTQELESGFHVQLTGKGYAANTTSAPIKATLISQTGRSFQVMTSDDASANNGAFNFMVFAPHWDNTSAKYNKSNL